MTHEEIITVWRAAREEAARATHVAQLPLRRRAWRGPAGAWLGAGLGNSLEFEDHRPYAPGDDLRHLDWPAFARTDQLVMKLHRHEASPQVDLVLDGSASQFVSQAKARRTLELVAFVMQSALEARALLRMWIVGVTAQPWETAAALASSIPRGLPMAAPLGPTWDRVAWRRDALRVLVSDLLFPIVTQPLVGGLGGPRGAGLILVPWTNEEADPAWDGRMEFEDAETQQRREQRVDGNLRTRYRQAYARHFDLWRDVCARHGVGLARIAAEPPLAAALSHGALREGLLDWAA